MAEKLKCLIVEDELMARKSLNVLCDKIISYSNNSDSLVNEMEYCKQFCRDNFTLDMIYKQILNFNIKTHEQHPFHLVDSSP